MKKAALHNLGCKVNAYETEAMQQLLEQNGYEIVPFSEKADVYVINTCSVTNIADRKSRQMLHRAKKLNPNSIVVAAGCYVQTSTEQAKADEAIDILIGNNKKHELVELLAAFEQKRQREEQQQEEQQREEQQQEEQQQEEKQQEEKQQEEKQQEKKQQEEQQQEKNRQKQDSIIDISGKTEYEEMALSRTAEHTRAFIKVQDGCNQFCSYCIIPYARGRVRSRDLGDVLEEVRRLAANGYREVVLTGIHLSSYGADTGENLLRLIQKVHEIEGIRRIRLGSLEPKIVTEEFARELAALPKVCPHFHLSLQSGCDATLKRMNRRYTCEEYRQGCNYLRKYFTHPAITTDVIVGFPGETEEEFEMTRAFLKEIAFFEVHIFKYSKRQGTKAAAMEHQIPEETKTERSNILFEDTGRMSEEFVQWYQDKNVEVLMEEAMTEDGDRYFVGHTPEYVKAAVKVTDDLANRIVQGKVAGILKDHVLLMETIKNID